MLVTVLRAGRLLALFDATRAERSLTELADALGLPRSTVHALLKTLCGTGLLRRTASRRYALGPDLHALAGRLVASEPAVALAQRAAEDLASRWGGTARVVVGDPHWGSAVVFQAEGPYRDPEAVGLIHRCQAVSRVLGVAEPGCGWDLETSRPGWCCVASCVRGSSGALVVDLCLPATCFYAHAPGVYDSVLSVCGQQSGWVRHTRRPEAVGRVSWPGTPRPRCGVPVPCARDS